MEDARDDNPRTAAWRPLATAAVTAAALSAALAFLSIDNHFEAISRGVIDTRDVFYYLSIMAISLVVATVALESRKWK